MEEEVIDSFSQFIVGSQKLGTSSQVRQELAFIPWVQKNNICYELGRSSSQGLVPRNSQVSINADSYDSSCNYDQS